jgi:DNA-binding transcriptional regulator YiaG
MSTQVKTKSKRQSLQPPYPYVLTLRDGRRVFVELPAQWVGSYQGEMTLLPPAVKFLDKVQAMAQKIEGVPSRGQIVALRAALGMTQKELGAAVGVDKLTVSRWERGELKPGAASVRRLRKLQQGAARRGVVVG